ncbi:MAG: hypothetical protein RLZZ93_1127, partial [Actinomycetota bacterium]
ATATGGARIEAQLLNQGALTKAIWERLGLSNA